MLQVTNLATQWDQLVIRFLKPPCLPLLSTAIDLLHWQALDGVTSSFGGCLRKVGLNGLPFGEKSLSEGEEPCSTFTEPGLFFQGPASHALLQESFEVSLPLLKVLLPARRKRARLFSGIARRSGRVTVHLI